ncbi:hypothetical protein pdam_00025034 [Pocillopora damicornis]|uniref:SWIM-type domain-containing protein n=1 Tax=Pocillopora damicornis TaxID=46731 RepID=A0A3M6U456_POCDA|nr:hypothetical protein pdam_00025034 [Pocillopora damicornis]
MASQSGVSARGERKDSDWTKKQSALCFRSQRKNEEPHKLSLKCGRGNNGDAKVLETSCSCKAGAGGHCHHMFALLYLLTHWSLLNLGEIPADKTCSNLPQAWSVPRGD